MRWRVRVGTTLIAATILGIGFQPALRWGVTRVLSRYTLGNARIDGHARWDPSHHTVDLGQITITPPHGAVLRVERAVVRLNPHEFLQRNLVIQDANITGVVVRQEKLAAWISDEALALQDHQGTSRGAYQGISRAAEGWPIEDWIESWKSQYTSKVAAAMRERDQTITAFHSELRTLRDRAEAITAQGDNVLRSREHGDAFRKAWNGLRQAIAEERLRLRELDRSLQQEIDAAGDTWKPSLHHALAETRPSTQDAIRWIASERLRQYADTYHAILQIAWTASLPLPPSAPTTQGRDIPLPGIPASETRIQQATLSGKIETGDQRPTHFKGHLAGWIDHPNGRPAQGDWDFELDTPSGANIHATLRPLTELPDSPHGLRLIAYLSESGRTAPIATLVMSDRSEDEHQLPHRVDLPISDPRLPMQLPWSDPQLRDCWNEIASSSSTTLNFAFDGADASAADQSCATLWNKLPGPDALTDMGRKNLVVMWEQANANYVGRVEEKARPHVDAVLRQLKTSTLRDWREVAARQTDLLLQLEHEAEVLKARAEGSLRLEGRLEERLARQQDTTMK